MNTFTQVEYLTIFSAIIYGFVASEFFTGWGDLLRNWSVYKRITYKYLLWTILIFVFLIDVWWGSWTRVTRMSESILMFSLTLTTPMIFYLIGVEIFPNNNGKANVAVFFKRNQSKLFWLLCALMVSNLVNTSVFNPQSFFRLEVYAIIVALTFCAYGAINKKEWVADLILIMTWAMVLWHVLLHKGTNVSFNSIPPFAQEEYLVIFVAIIYGYAVSGFFTGWGRMIRFMKWQELKWMDVAWTILIFLILIDTWWGSWERNSRLVDDVVFFYISLASPLIFYFLSVAMFPSQGFVEKNAFGKHFESKSSAIFKLVALLLLVNLASGTFFGENEIMSSKNYFRLAGAGFAFVVARNNTSMVRNIILILGTVLFILHILVDEFGFEIM